MVASPWQKGIILAVVAFGVVVSTLVFGVMHHDDGNNKIEFELTDQTGTGITQKDLAGRHLLIFFGFTSCTSICPIQMSKLSSVMAALDQADRSADVIPILISVDAERDDPEKMAGYLQNFHKSFVGLTGSRTMLKRTAERFKTILDEAPRDADPGYQLAHSSVVYVVDPFSRVIDIIPLSDTRDDMANRILGILH